MNQVKWFVEEVRPHEPFLRSYLRGSFPTVRDVDDVVQESYCRLIKTRERRDVPSARAFLFRIARNIAIDFLRRERRSPVQAVADLASIHAIDDLVTSAELLTREEKSRHLGEALASLPTRCREIVLLHKIKGIPQSSIARQLGLSEKTVANQVCRGVRRCEHYLRRRGIEFF